MRQGICLSLGILLALAAPAWAIGPWPYMPGEVGPDHRVWVNADYLYWWIKDAPQPVPLVTTGPNTPFLAPGGLIGNGNTEVLFPTGNMPFGGFNGLRLNGGMWLDCHGTVGLEAGAFVTEQRSSVFHSASDAAGNPILSIPYFDINPAVNSECVFNVANPSPVVLNPCNAGNSGDRRGQIFIDTTSRFGGINADFVFGTLRTPSFQIYFLSGFQYLGLSEQFNLRADTQVIAPPFSGPHTIPEDHFRTLTQFFGAELGAKFRWQGSVAFVDLLTKVGVGANQQTLEISGQTTNTDAAGTVTSVTPGGIFSQTSNIGQQGRNNFSFTPQIQLRMGLDVSSNLKISAAYDFMYWTNVLRASDQIDREVNSSQSLTLGGTGTLVGPSRPGFLFNQSDFYAHGFSVGIEFRR